MSEFLDNGALQKILAGLVCVVILGVFGWLKYKKDRNIATTYLKDLGIDVVATYRASHESGATGASTRDRAEKVAGGVPERGGKDSAKGP